MAATTTNFDQLPAPINLNAIAGDDFQIPLLIKDDGTLVDWSDYTLTAEIEGDEEFTITMGTAGEAFCTLTDEQTTLMGVFSGKYWIRLTRTADDYVRTIMQGKVKLKAA